MQVKFNGVLTPLSAPIHVKDRIDEFVVVDQDMNEIKSTQLTGKKLYLTLPSVDTSVCSLELSKFVELVKDFDITVLAISMDLPFALNRWCQDHASGNVVAVSDFRYHDFADVSGLFMPSIGLFSRSVLLVDEHDIVQYMEIVDDVSQEPDYEEVVRIIRM